MSSKQSVFGRLFALFAVVLAGFAVAVLCAVLMGNRAWRHADDALDDLSFSQALLHNQSAHARWMEQLSAWLGHPAAGTAPADDCAFGRWLEGGGRDAAARLFPGKRDELAALVDQHTALHSAAAKARTLAAQGKREEATRMYAENVRPLSQGMMRTLDDMHKRLLALAAENQAAGHSQTRLALFTMLGVLLLTALVGVGMLVALRASLDAPLHQLAAYAQAAAGGNLDAPLPCAGRNDAMGRLAQGVAAMTTAFKDNLDTGRQRLAEALEQLEQANARRKQAEDHAAAARAMSEGLGNLADRMQSLTDALGSEANTLSEQLHNIAESNSAQSSMLDTASTSMQSLNTGLTAIARNAASAAESSAGALDKAQKGEDVVTRSVEAISHVSSTSERLQANMRTLGTEAESIDQVMRVISDIADQTNLLALNAAIEAARAGEAGRGFAVVADEVRKLAEKTMQATQEVGGKIQSIQRSIKTSVSQVQEAGSAVETSTDLVRQSGESLQEIVNLANVNASSVHRIAAETEAHSEDCREITGNLGHAAEIAELTADEMKQAMDHVRNLAHSAQSLRELGERLKAVRGTQS